MPVLNQRNLSTIAHQINKYVENQFIQKSKIPTLHFQSALPRLPIPKLELSCQRYLAAQKPLYTNEEYNKIVERVKNFENGIGKTLQEKLIENDKLNKHTSYISELWFDMYLRDRKPLPINTNPMLILNDDDRSEYNDQAIRAANLIISSLKFYKSLNSNCLEPEVFHLNPKKSDTELFRNLCSYLPSSLAYITAYLMKAYPLDMSQYQNLFNTNRIPELNKDRLINEKAQHITIQYKGHFYILPVLSEDNNILSANYILANIKYILNKTKSNCEFPIGILTTLERNQWAKIRNELINNGNEKQLKLIDSSLFNICLDDENAGNDRPLSIVRKFLHSDGTNRMFDKSISLIVAKDGISGINFEHSWGDGVAVLRYLQDIFKDTKNNPVVNSQTIISETDSLITTKVLDFNLNDNLKNSIKLAKDQFNQTCNNLDIKYVLDECMGKEECKKKSISPDAYMQLAFQVAYHKISNKFVPTYESCSTAAFKHGRTEAIRSCTSATQEFTLAINSKKNQASLKELEQLMKNCSETHNRLVREAATGQGFDRHLFALKALSDQEKINVELFNSPEYININQNILSTSTLNSPAIFAGGFGPVVEHGLGISYAIKDEYLGALVSCYRNKQNADMFIDALKTSLDEMEKILQYKSE